MAFVQASAQSHTTSGSNNTPSLNGVTAGNLLVLTVAYAQQTNGNPPTVSGWTAAENPAAQSFLAGAAFCGAAIFYLENAPSGTNSPTVTPAAGSTGCAITCQIEEHSGFPTSGTLGVHTNASAASGTSGNTGTTGSTTSANAVVVSALALADVAGASHAAWGISTPASSGYTSAGVHQDDTSTGRPAEFSYLYVSATGTQTASWTWSFSAANQGVIATFYQSGGGAPTITAQPVGASAAVGATAVYGITATGATSYQWQYSTNGGETWASASGGSGADTDTYTTPVAVAGMNGWMYRCVATSAGGSTNSLAAYFFVSGLPNTGRGRRLPTSGWFARTENKGGLCTGANPNLLRKNSIRAAGEGYDSDIASAWADWFIAPAPFVPEPLRTPPPIVGTQRNRPGRTPYSSGKYFRPDTRFFGEPAAGGGAQVIAVGQAIETDTTFSITPRSITTLGQPSETDLAQPITATLRTTLGQPAETDVAQAMAQRFIQAVGQVGETDTAQPIVARLVAAVGQPSETDTAQSFAVSGPNTLGQTQETDSAQPITARLVQTVGQASETDLPQPITAALRVTLGQPSELDVAQTMGALLARVMGQPAETDAAQPMAAHVLQVLGQVQEVDTAQPAGSSLSIGQVSETDAAQAMFERFLLQLGIAHEVDLALPLADRAAESILWRYDVPAGSWRFDVPAQATAWQYDVPSMVTP